MNTMKKFSNLGGEEIESVTTRKIAINSGYDKTVWYSNQSIFQEFETFLKTNKLEQRDNFPICRILLLFLLLIRYQLLCMKLVMK